MTGIVALLLFAFFALVGYAVSGWAQDREETKEALGRRLTTMTGAPVGGASAALMKDRRLSRIGLLNTILQQLGVTKNLVRVIRQAGLQKRVGEGVLYMLLLAAAAFLLVTLFVGKTAFAVLAGVIAGLLPLMIVLRMRRRRPALIRERFKLLREVRVLTAQGRLSGMVLTALPFFVALALILFNPEYFRPMMESKTGLYMTGYGLCSIVLGHILIQRIVRIKV